MVRYMTFIAVSLLFALYYVGVLLVNQYVFHEVISLQGKLFSARMDASVLDERVTYSCSQPWSYELSQDPAHQDALAFY